MTLLHVWQGNHAGPPTTTRRQAISHARLENTAALCRGVLSLCDSDSVEYQSASLIVLFLIYLSCVSFFIFFAFYA